MPGQIQNAVALPLVLPPPLPLFVPSSYGLFDKNLNSIISSDGILVPGNQFFFQRTPVPGVKMCGPDEGIFAIVVIG